MKFWLGKLVLFLLGWKLAGQPLRDDKYIVMVAPHTSNWDFIIGLACAFAFRIQIFWLGKHTLFVWPLAVLLKRLGGIPIDRRSKQNTVEQVKQAFEERKQFIVSITPEGTRTRVECWKSGFYHIAIAASVPILLCFPL